MPAWNVVWRTLIAAALLIVAPHSESALVTECVAYGDVSLTGRLVRQTFPGPPDFERFSKGDKPLVIWILQLDQGICVARTDSGYQTIYDEKEIQLLLGPDQYVQADEYAQYQHLLGQNITAIGRLIPGGGWYEKRLVLAADEVTTAGARP